MKAALDTQKKINSADDNTKKKKKIKEREKNKSIRDAKDSKVWFCFFSAVIIL